MFVKVAWKQWKTFFGEPHTLLFIFGLPFAFRYLLPAFESIPFPAVLTIFVLLGLHATSDIGRNLRAGLTLFPITARDHVLGLFTFQLSAVLFSAGLGALYALLADPSAFARLFFPKAFALGILIAAVMTALALWLRPEISRVANMFIIVFALNFILTQPIDDAVFLPWAGVPAALILALAVFILFLLLSLRYPPTL